LFISTTIASAIDSLLTSNTEFHFKGQAFKERELIEGTAADTLLLILE